MAIASLVRPAAQRRVDPADIITVKDVAEMFMLSTHTIYKLVEHGKLRHYRVPGTRAIRFLRSELLQMMTEQAAE